jgi:hypothetical protein
MTPAPSAHSPSYRTGRTAPGPVGRPHSGRSPRKERHDNNTHHPHGGTRIPCVRAPRRPTSCTRSSNRLEKYAWMVNAENRAPKGEMSNALGTAH